MRAVPRPWIALAIAVTALAAGVADAHPYMWPLNRAQNYNWNAGYAHGQYGQPVAMVVPPTATMQTNWRWGVASSRVSRLDHQFGRNYPGQGPFGGPFQNTPVWPQDTTQFGVYNVRAPW
ncbi:MAG: hypothetical protein ACRCT8_12625 [Lacipirellulaceae bacterium]